MEDKNCNHEFTTRVVAVATYVGEHKGYYETNDLLCCDCYGLIKQPVFNADGFNADVILGNPKLSREEIYDTWRESYERTKEKTLFDEDEYKEKQKIIKDQLKELEQNHYYHYFNTQNCRDRESLELICNTCKEFNEKINKLHKEYSDIYYETLTKYQEEYFKKKESNIST